MGSMGSVLRGSYSTDVAVAVAMPWAAVQKAVVQWMLGNSPGINTGTGAEGSV